MKQIEISETAYNHLLAYASERGIERDQVNRLADRAVMKMVGVTGQEEFSGVELIARFAEFRGTLQETTLAEIAGYRHRGLD